MLLISLGQGRLGNGDPESGLDRQGRSDHVGRRTGAPFSCRQLASNGQKAARVQVESVHQFICQSPGLIFVRGIDANLAGPGRCREPGGRIPGDRQGNEELSLLVREYSLEQFAERAEAPPDARLWVSFARLFPQLVVADVTVHAPSRVLLRILVILTVLCIHTLPPYATYGRRRPLHPSPLCQPFEGRIIPGSIGQGETRRF
jgi:hypothetical protein